MHQAKTIIGAAMLFSGGAMADFFFGAMSGEMVDGSIGNPFDDRYYRQILYVPSQSSVCDSAGIRGNPDPPSGVPSDPWINWCGVDFQIGARKLQLNSNDPCGKDVQGGQTVDNGKFYAHLLDRDNDFQSIGDCVFEQGGNQGVCGNDGAQVVSTSVRCKIAEIS